MRRCDTDAIELHVGAWCGFCAMCRGWGTWARAVCGVGEPRRLQPLVLPHSEPCFFCQLHLQNTCSPLRSEMHNSYIWWDLAVEGFLGCGLHGRGAWKLQTK